MDEMPVIVKNLDDDESVIIMVDSNLQRENILPSERAKAYQMKLEAIKRKAGRPSRENFVASCDEFFRADEVVGAEAGMSKDSVRRFIRLNNLELPLRDKVDSGELAFTPAVELSYLKPEEQQWLPNRPGGHAANAVPVPGAANQKGEQGRDAFGARA